VSTRRERLERKLEKREGWADSREAKSEEAFDRAHTIADGIPLGQPILVGHHSQRRAERDQQRIVQGMAAGHEHAKAAEHHRDKAAGLERQLATSVFSDDADAVERLQAQIVELEAERDRIKAYNQSCRKGAPDASVLDDKQRDEVLSLARIGFLKADGQFPGYALSNLGATIRQKKQRVEQITRDRERVATGDRGRGKSMLSRYTSTCAECGEPIKSGDAIMWFRLTKEAVHVACGGPS
jgi:hypothetical protein